MRLKRSDHNWLGARNLGYPQEALVQKVCSYGKVNVEWNPDKQEDPVNVPAGDLIVLSFFAATLCAQLWRSCEIGFV